jgi:acyl-CoA reductase-like NAD-dependent aldehyde dehydrogenase
VGLELGGKDPAYVREDADIKWTAENLVDGAMFNSGQSCMSLHSLLASADRKVVRLSEFTSIHQSTTSLSRHSPR